MGSGRRRCRGRSRGRCGPRGGESARRRFGDALARRPAARWKEEMKKVAVLGGGPAGAFAAEQLASAGIETIVFDEKLAWEKPCGGGLTYKAYRQYPFLLENSTPKKLITETVLAAPDAGAVNLRLR